MAATIENLRNNALYQIWEFTGAFDSVIATNGPDSDIELWTKARKCAIEIGKSTFVDKEAGFNEDNSFYPSEKFRRFCSEAEFDKEHDSCWVMTFKAVLFTMVYPLGIFIEDVAEEEEEDMENSEHKIMFESLKFPKYDILGLTKKGKIYRNMIVVLKKWRKICDEQNPYLKYNQEDEKYLEEDLACEENDVLNPYIAFDARDYSVEEHFSQSDNQEDISIEDNFVAPANNLANDVFTEPNLIYKALVSIMEKFFIDDKKTRNISLSRIYRVLSDYGQFKNDYNYIGFVRALKGWNLLGEKSEDDLANLSTGMNSYFRPRKHRGKDREVLAPNFHNWNSEELNRHKPTCLDIEKDLKDKANVTYRYQTDNT